MKFISCSSFQNLKLLWGGGRNYDYLVSSDIFLPLLYLAQQLILEVKKNFCRSLLKDCRSMNSGQQQKKSEGKDVFGEFLSMEHGPPPTKYQIIRYKHR